jgi:hypothetical protein
VNSPLRRPSATADSDAKRSNPWQHWKS